MAKKILKKREIIQTSYGKVNHKHTNQPFNINPIKTGITDPGTAKKPAKA
jgi:hypothetical protein